MSGRLDLAEIIDRAMTSEASALDVTRRRVRAHTPSSELMPLDSVPVAAWQMLARTCLEPNGYYLPEWELAVNASAQGRTGTSALCTWNEASPSRLIGLMPVSYTHLTLPTNREV